jgi:hypothetical protein
MVLAGGVEHRRAQRKLPAFARLARLRERAKRAEAKRSGLG